jgi:hypothetical protein
MSRSFTHTFEEISVTIEGRVKLVTGTVGVDYNTYREDGQRWYEVEPDHHVVVTDYSDDETEYTVPCEFTLDYNTAAYKAILLALDSGVYSLVEACSDDYLNSDWDR